MTVSITRREELPDLPFRRYRKLPNPVTAVQLTALEDVSNPFAVGSYHGKPGDWRIVYGTRPDGSIDTAICDGDIFARTYEHLDGDQYRKKATVVIEASQLDTPLDIVTLEGPSHGEPGDWLLLGIDGEPYFNSDAFFTANYLPAE